MINKDSFKYEKNKDNYEFWIYRKKLFSAQIRKNPYDLKFNVIIYPNVDKGYRDPYYEKVNINNFDEAMEYCTKCIKNLTDEN